MNTEQAKQAKKHYQQPQLVEYGNIQEITQIVGNNGAFDANNPVKTQI